MGVGNQKGDFQFQVSGNDCVLAPTAQRECANLAVKTLDQNFLYRSSSGVFSFGIELHSLLMELNTCT